MPHRDDREALNAKLEAQARELAEAKEENERLRASNARKATELERMRALGAPPPTEPTFDDASMDDDEGATNDASTQSSGATPPSAMPPVHPMHHPLHHHPFSPGLRRQLGALMIATSILVGGLSLSAIRLAGHHGHGCRGPMAFATTAVHASFTGSVREASGTTTHAEGEPCTFDATFEEDARSTLHRLADLTITCGDQRIYAPLAGALEGNGIVWTSETPGLGQYELRARDGDSTSTISIDSWDGRARVQGADWVLDLDIAPVSAPVDSGHALPSIAEPLLVRTGHVTEASGLDVGTACTVVRRPAGDDPYQHRVVVRCGGHTLYGAGPTGYTYPSHDSRISLDDDVSMDDGDARMTLDLIQNEVHLEDGLGLVAQHVDIALD